MRRKHSSYRDANRTLDKVKKEIAEFKMTANKRTLACCQQIEEGLSFKDLDNPPWRIGWYELAWKEYLDAKADLEFYTPKVAIFQPSVHYRDINKFMPD